MTFGQLSVILINPKTPHYGRKDVMLKDKDKRREYCREWRKRNPNRVKQYNSSWYERHKDYFKEFYEKQKQKVINEQITPTTHSF